MKLLIVTQVIDTEHPILGFFHRWVEEFAKHCEQVHVICLQEGKHSLPANVKIHSLGKELKVGRLVYLYRFYKLIFQLRHEYDNVFVHMNQIYVILGAPFWRAAGKKIGLWYMHGSISNTLRIAEKFSHYIFTGSPESFRLESKKVFITGHGIDTVLFTPLEVSKDIDLITVGRLSESKNLFKTVDILKEIRKKINVSLTIVGTSVTEKEKNYEQDLFEHIKKQGLKGEVNFAGRVSQFELPALLNRAKVFVTTAQNGSLDKAILEAMACGLLVISMAPGSVSLPLGIAQTNNTTDFITQLECVLKSSVFIKKEYVGFVKKNHSIQTLIPKILRSYV